MEESRKGEHVDEGRKRRGRPSLDPLERFKRLRARQERWKRDNRETYLEQKRQLSRRPEYMARRRQTYARKKGGSIGALGAKRLTDTTVAEATAYTSLVCFKILCANAIISAGGVGSLWMTWAASRRNSGPPTASAGGVYVTSPEPNQDRTSARQIGHFQVLQ